MPRSRGRAAPARAAPTRPTTTQNRQVTPQQQQPNRGASTTAQPPAGAASGAQGRSPGLFGQMASTAAGVAVGSSIGHAIGGMFGGGHTGSGEVAEGQANDNAVAAQAQQGYDNNSWGEQSCEQSAKGLSNCLDQNGGNMQICSWYLDQLKSCQAAASQY